MIFTRFHRADRINKNKQYDPHGKVDRLSYVDNTALVKRFVMEGRNLAMARAKALRSGMYSGDLKEIDQDNGIPIPVYQMDPTVAQPIINSALAFFSETASGAQPASSVTPSEGEAPEAVHESSPANNG